jgi:RHS repeat-associated protein
VLNANVSGSGQIGMLDTTTLANGPYWIQMQATDTNGNSEYSLVLVTVTGNYKPGRLTTTVTDLVVPSNGLPINIQRSYDSLNANTSSDFGYGWSLGINVDLTVDPLGNVTFTLGGQRRTFYLTPQQACGIAGCLPWYLPIFTPEPGLHGTLTDDGVVCLNSCITNLLIPDGGIWMLAIGGGQYIPTGYIYTDPSGTSYTISAGGALQSIQDRSGNGLTITANGITSTTGLNVPFVRDSSNRITQITDPQGNIYSYGYDEDGNLATVTYPNTTQTTYTYDANHLYTSGTDARGNPLPVTAYYGPGDTDPNGLPLNGRVKSGTDALGQTTSYAYNLATNATTITYPQDPADGNGLPDIATIVYNSHGDVLTLTDPLGNTTTHTYDSNYNLLSTTDPLGHTTSYTYDANGNQTSITYPATATSTNTTSYTNYNQYSEPTSTTDENGNVRTFNYDANYNPQSVTDSIGTLMSTTFNTNGTMAASAIGYDITLNPARASQFTYDANGNMASNTDALGRTTSNTYNALGQKLTMTEPVPSGSSAAAATTTYTYDAFGHLIQAQAPLGRTTSSTYDGNGNKTSDTDARGNSMQFKYDALNRLIETDYPDGTKATRTYDFRNNVVTDTDQGGHVTLLQYDLAGRQISVTQAYGTANATTTTTTYDAAGRVTAQTDALGHVTNTTYDAAGNVISATMGYGTANASPTSYTYDNARNQISMTDGNGNATQFAYDARKRLTATTYPDQTTETRAYDGPGNLILTTDQAGNQVQYNYDAANQQVSVIQVDSPNSPANTAVYGYDVDGNVITSEDANSHTTAQSFDLLGEQTSTTLPDGKLTEAHVYDNNGNLATVTHFNGATTTYTYDALSRLLSRSTPGEPTVSHTYTATGQYATTTDASGTTTYTYDNMDRITTKVTPEGTLNYTYDAASNVASIRSSNLNGASMSYTYDDLNRLATVTDNRTGGVTTYSYDSANNVASVTWPNGVQSTFTYDTLNRVTGLSSQPASYTYQRGPTGNLLNATESTGRQVNWTYDGIYRLTNESIANDPSNNDGSVSYTLDPVGNRSKESSSLPDISSGSWSFNADDELSGESYDQNGNVTSLGGKSFTYNSQNQMIAMTASGTTVAMIYDGFGNRVAKTGNGVTTQYLVEDDNNPTGVPQVFDELTNGVVTRTYAYGLQRIDQDQIIDGAWIPSFFGYDEGGSVRNLTGANGVVTDRFEYDAFGNSFTVSGTTPNNYLYRGEQHDPDLGLYYLRTRYYNPQSGRFTGVDPLTDQDQPRYEYAGADPVNGIDPMGTEDMIECALLGANKLGCPFQFPSIFLPRIPIPNFCQLLSEDPGSGDSSKCRHWTVRVNYRPILTGKFGKNCNKEHGIPGCHLPLRLAEHSYVEIDGPTDSDKHTWGVLGTVGNRKDQEMYKDRNEWGGDPTYPAGGVQSQVVQASDQQAQAFEQALNNKVGPPYPDCPSCGVGIYHNGPFPPIDVVSFFSAFNSNTFTWNAVKNAGLTPPPDIGNAPGYHFSPRYGSYPF